MNENTKTYGIWTTYSDKKGVNWMCNIQSTTQRGALIKYCEMIGVKNAPIFINEKNFVPKNNGRRLTVILPEFSIQSREV